jgi:hypothetical protein
MTYLSWKRLNPLLLKLPVLLLMTSLIYGLAGCAQSTVPGQATPTAHPSLTASPQVLQTPSPVVTPGTVLFTAKWLRGLANWQHSQGWSIAQGQLQANSVPETTLTIPYIPTVPTYTVEVQAQIVRVLKPLANEFTIGVEKASESDGFTAGFTDLHQYLPQEQPDPSFYTGFIQIIPDHLPPQLQVLERDYVPGTIWHTYGVTVQGNEADLSLDGHVTIRSMSSEAAFTRGPLVLKSEGLLLLISSLRITAA